MIIKVTQCLLLILNVVTSSWTFFEETLPVVVILKSDEFTHPFCGTFLRQLTIKLKVQVHACSDATEKEQPVKEKGHT